MKWLVNAKGGGVAICDLAVLLSTIGRFVDDERQQFSDVADGRGWFSLLIEKPK